jgi:hypothetical protein
MLFLELTMKMETDKLIAGECTRRSSTARNRFRGVLESSTASLECRAAATRSYHQASPPGGELLFERL